MSAPTEPDAGDFPFVAQAHARDCGFSCLRMILRYHGDDFEFGDPEHRALLSRRGLDLRTLTELAQERGFRCSVMRGTFEELTREVSLPCIIHWQDNHFMVVYEISEDTVFIANPARGLEAHSFDEFRQGWATASAEGRVDHADHGDAAEGIVLCLTPDRPSPR